MDKIELEDETLRETLFLKIFANDVLVPDKTEMLKLKDMLEEEGGIVRSIYSLDGFCIDKDGLFSKMPESLEYIFGNQFLAELNVREGMGMLCVVALFVCFNVNKCVSKRK